jgi:two-component system response regulator YesN
LGGAWLHGHVSGRERHPGHGNLPCIAAGDRHYGYPHAGYGRTGAQFGANDYELKPVKIKNLIRRVSELREQYYREKTTGQDGPFERTAERPEELGPGVKKAIDHMRRHFHKELSIEVMAQYLEITPNYFSHLFKKETGIPFSEYLNKIRIHEAKRLLSETNKMAYQVMDDVGFRNYKYFVQLFKKMEGMSPTDYRKTKS